MVKEKVKKAKMQGFKKMSTSNEIVVSGKNKIKQEIKPSNDKDLIDIRTAANRLKLTKQAVREKFASLNINPITYVMKGDRKNVKTFLYSWSEIMKQQQQQQLVKWEKQAIKLSNDKDILVVGNAFSKQLDNLEDNIENIESIEQTAMLLMQKALEKQKKLLSSTIEESKNARLIINQLNKQKEQLEKENKALLYDNEQMQIQVGGLMKDLEKAKQFKDDIQEKLNNKELRAKVNKLIRDIAKWRFNNKYNDAYNYYYEKYNKLHNFPKNENNDKYISIIQERGHLREFLEIVKLY